ncbi:MAG: hypothetical protein HYX78_04535 [Armatimonadetes bacterium]|nr:hypothetical protein [Armatimonadota bacterium]
MGDKVTNGMALGGIDTGCIDLETNGLLGYCTIFNTHVPRRGPINLPILGLSVGGKTWVLCDKSPKPAGGSWQVRPASVAVNPVFTDLKLDGVETVRQIEYWGHYPVADLEFLTDAPVSVGLRAWNPFLPGDVVGSMAPGIVFEVQLRNTTDSTQKGTIAFSFPGPTEKEAGTNQFEHGKIQGDFNGIQVKTDKATYALGVSGKENLRTGGELGADGTAWSKIATSLPTTDSTRPGSSVAVDFSLGEGESKVVRFILTWYSPTWKGGGYNWATTGNTFTHMYAKYYPDASKTAQMLARDHKKLLDRVLAWQQVIYADKKLPGWLQDSLINNLYMITEDGLWCQKKDPLPAWVKEEDGLFGLIECPRACPQIECIPCSFYGNMPLVYFFPELALSTLRGYKGYQFPEGAAVWIFGGCTDDTPPIDFARPSRGYQTTTNGISLASMVDRYLLCYGDKQKDLAKEFHPTIKQNMIFTVNLRTTPSYSIGQRIISMPDGNIGTEWFEAPEPGWFGMVSHVGGLHLAQLRIAERIARQAGDEEFAKQCKDWAQAGMQALDENLWNGSYYLNCLEPETGKKSDLVFAYQLDGQWVTLFHGLPGVFREDRVKTTLDTIKKSNLTISKTGVVNYAHADGSPAAVGGYGTYACFIAEAFMLAMHYMYEGQPEVGMEIVHRVCNNMIITHGYTWDIPVMTRGDVDTGEVALDSHDYYQVMMLWSIPAAIEGKDFSGPVKPGGLVDRIVRAARGA